MSGSNASGSSTSANLSMSFKKGSVLNMIKAGEEPFPRDTPLLPKSDITLDQLMHDEEISYLEAVEVMFRLRKESNLAEMPFVPKPKAKAKAKAKGKAKALPEAAEEPAAPKAPSAPTRDQRPGSSEDPTATKVDLEGLLRMHEGVQKRKANEASKSVEAPAGPDGSEASKKSRKKACEPSAKSVEPVAKAKVSGKAVEPAAAKVSAKAVEPAVPKVSAKVAVPKASGKALEPAVPKVSAKAVVAVPTKVSTPAAKASKRTVEPSVPAEVSESGVEPSAKVAKTAQATAKASGKAVEPAVPKVSRKAVDDADRGGHDLSMDNCETQTLSSGWSCGTLEGAEQQLQMQKSALKRRNSTATLKETDSQLMEGLGASVSQVGSTQPAAELLQALEDMRKYQSALEEQAMAKGLKLPPKPCAILPELIAAAHKPEDAKATGAPSADPAVEGLCEPDDIECELEEMLNSFDDDEQDGAKEEEGQEMEEGQRLNDEGEDDEQELKDEDGKELEEDAADEEEEDGKGLEEDAAEEEDEAQEEGSEEEEDVLDGKEPEEDATKDGEEDDPKGKGAKGRSKPVATPVRAKNPPPLLRLQSSDSLDAPSSTAAASGVPKVHVFNEPAREEVVVNSTTHKREYMRLERGELLRRWISSGENLQACEAQVTASRKNTATGRRRRRLVAVKDMLNAPYHFSKCLGGIVVIFLVASLCFCSDSLLLINQYVLLQAYNSRSACWNGRRVILPFLPVAGWNDRQKVESIISRGGGVEDVDAPGCLPETKFWVTVEEEVVDETEATVEQRLSVRARPSADMMTSILDVGQLQRQARSSPLNGDVLRAFDTYNTEIAKAANIDSARAAGSAPGGRGARSVAGSRASSKQPRKPLIEECFKNDGDKHSRWSSEIRKEIGQLAQLLMDLPEGSQLKSDLEDYQHRLLQKAEECLDF
ncbi:unnamed protein product [Symbiodinium sp. CCMP2456]|nr:unnamed protein product [Symbiodinium sp. CCMP2456]